MFDFRARKARLTPNLLVPFKDAGTLAAALREMCFENIKPAAYTTPGEPSSTV